MPETWYAHPNDLIGGWAVMNRDHPPSGLDRNADPEAREVATFMGEADARRIAELHNAAAAGRLLPEGGQTEHGWARSDRHAVLIRNECDTGALLNAYPGSQVYRRQVGPWVAVDQEVTDAQ